MKSNTVLFLITYQAAKLQLVYLPKMQVLLHDDWLSAGYTSAHVGAVLESLVSDIALGIERDTVCTDEWVAEASRIITRTQGV